MTEFEDRIARDDVLRKIKKAAEKGLSWDQTVKKLLRATIAEARRSGHDEADEVEAVVHLAGLSRRHRRRARGFLHRLGSAAAADRLRMMDQARRE